MDFLVSVLNDFGIGYVFDLSPGSGAMAIACVRNGVAYDGVCANEEHQQWLNGLLDMATLAVEGEAGEKTKEGGQSLAAKNQAALWNGRGRGQTDVTGCRRQGGRVRRKLQRDGVTAAAGRTLMLA